MTKTKETPESSTIKSITYNYDSRELKVEFKHNSSYLYVNVPKELFEAFVDAPSKGKFFHKNVKDVFKYSRLK